MTSRSASLHSGLISFAITLSLCAGASAFAGAAQRHDHASQALPDFEATARTARGNIETTIDVAAVDRSVSPRPAVDTAAPSARMKQFALAAAPAAKISVRAGGMVRVTQPELVAAGFVAGDPRRLQLYRDGMEQAILVEGESDGSFGPSDAIVFHGEGIDTHYSDTRVYWLLAGSSAGKRMAFTSLGSTPPEAGSSFLATATQVQNLEFYSQVNAGDEDGFFGSPITSFGLTHAVLQLPAVDTASTDQATVEVSVLGGPYTTGFTPAHRVRVFVNGNELGDFSFGVYEVGKAAFSFSQSLLLPGANSVSLRSLNGSPDINLIDSVKLSYWHTWEAQSNVLTFTAPARTAVTIHGFTSGSVRVFDVTDPLSHREVATTTTSAGVTYDAQIRVPGDATRTMIAVADDAISQAESIELNSPSALSRKGNTYGWVLIGHGTLLTAASSLEGLRQDEGYSTLVADVQDVYDEFSFGSKDANAIRDFLQHASSNWKSPPSHVVLLGDASVDPRSYKYPGSDLLPTKLVNTEFLKTSSDDWFSDFDDDGIADIPLGRLPAFTLAEATTMVSKIVGYGTAPAGPWTNRALMLADQNDFQGNDFTTAAEGIVAVTPGTVVVDKTYADLLGTSGARTKLFADLATGAGYLNFLGHGSGHTWGLSPFFNSADARTMPNADLPLVIALTCLTGAFHDVVTDLTFPAGGVMAEAMLENPNGGAVAVWGSSGLTFMVGQEPANQELVRRLFPTDAADLTTIGRAIQFAKLATPDPDVRKTWILFGDPAMRLRYQP